MGDGVKVVTVLAVLLLMVFGVGFFILINDAVADVDVETWDFVGADVAAAILPAVPTVFLICFLLPPLYILIKKGDG